MRNFLAFLFILTFTFQTYAGRTTVSLDGRWQIADSMDPDTPPQSFSHTVPLPGLANLAEPAFPKVDAFYSREHLANRIRAKLAPEEWLTNFWKGKVDQDRNYFWYRKTFRAPARTEFALLKINKAQFGTAVWLNGQKLGEYSGCFSASHFELQNAIRWSGDNTLLIRIGAHPAVLPDTYPTGSDFEKIKWTPGIYDSVSLIFCQSPLIQSIQVAPRIASSEIIVQTTLKNTIGKPVSSSLSHVVKTWQGSKRVAVAEPQSVSLSPNEERTFTQTIRIPDARLWSPEEPFLYSVESSTRGDNVTTRFGMREFRFDGATRRALLNGKVYYLRGSNITLHRFFEDPLCKDLPWNERWVRKLLVDLPKDMHWNYFRFCIGPVPDRWLEICDEAGLLIQNEFFVWTGGPGWYKGYSRTHDEDEMIRQYKDWMRDNWNHPSVAVWDANNETKDDIFGAKIIPAVQSLDLSKRPWENSYNPPAGPNDPVEDHPYLMQSGAFGKLNFKMSDLEKMDGKPRGSLPSKNHAPLINEYGWLWLNRDGTPTRLTENLYPQLMGTTNVTSRERLDLYAYLLAGKTEFWRAHRQYAGIIHFVYLTCSYPGVYTADHFTDVTHLKLDPAFADYMGEAFKPLGVYLNFFQPTLAPGPKRNFTVMLVNDYERLLSGNVLLALQSKQGKTLARSEQAFSIQALGNATIEIPLEIPSGSGECVLKAIARPDKSTKVGPTTSRRWVNSNNLAGWDPGAWNTSTMPHLKVSRRSFIKSNLVATVALGASQSFLLSAGASSAGVPTTPWAGRHPVSRDHPRLLGSREELRALARQRVVEYQRLKAVASDSEGDDYSWIISAALVAAIEGDLALGNKIRERAMKFISGPIRVGHVTFGTDLALCGLAFDLCPEAWTDADRGRLCEYINKTIDDNVQSETSVFHNAWYGYKNWGIGLACYATYHENPRAKEYLQVLEEDYLTRAAPALELAGEGGGWAEGYYIHYWLYEWLVFCEVAHRCEGLDYYAAAPKFYRNRAIASMFETYPGISEYNSRRCLPMGDGGGRTFGGDRDKTLSARRILVNRFRDDQTHQAAHGFNETTPRSAVGNYAYKDFLWHDASVPKADYKQLPLSHVSRGPGFVYARSSWEDDATCFFFKCGDRFTAHQHLDLNHFLIYKHAELAGDGGHYDEFGTLHDVNFHVRTIAHSTILVLDPDERWPNIRAGEVTANDGGQHHSWKHHNGAASDPADRLKQKAQMDIGELLAFEEHGSYLYVAGDATRAYSPRKLSLFTRQIVFLRPNTFIIFDRLNSTRPEFKKTWLLQAMRTPEKSGSHLVITNGKGRLFVQTLWPQRPEVRLVSGAELYQVGARAYPPRRTIGAAPECRIEVSPVGARTADIFAHVLSTAGADTSATEPAVLKVEDNRMIISVGAAGFRFLTDGLSCERVS